MDWTILLLVCVPVLIGIAGTRFFVSRRQRRSLVDRLEGLLGSSKPLSSESILRAAAPTQDALSAHVDNLIKRSRFNFQASELFLFSGLLFCLPLIAALFFNAHEGFYPVIVVFSLLSAGTPYLILRVRSEATRLAFQKQLPNAMDLMVSVLRSGHSVPQAVKSVADEIAHPCGAEFAEVFQRINLGQSLPEALTVSVSRWESFELDLIRRATALQAEVGGSLSELLDKTNTTLRQRIKLKYQIQVVTASSRLSAWIAGLMPFVVAIAFQVINPDYMRPLVETNIGRMLLVAALLAQVLGVAIMHKMTSLRV